MSLEEKIEKLDTTINELIKRFDANMAFVKAPAVNALPAEDAKPAPKKAASKKVAEEVKAELPPVTMEVPKTGDDETDLFGGDDLFGTPERQITEEELMNIIATNIQLSGGDKAFAFNTLGQFNAKNFKEIKTEDFNKIYAIFEAKNAELKAVKK